MERDTRFSTRRQAAIRLVYTLGSTTCKTVANCRSSSGNVAFSAQRVVLCMQACVQCSRPALCVRRTQARAYAGGTSCVRRETVTDERVSGTTPIQQRYHRKSAEETSSSGSKQKEERSYTYHQLEGRGLERLTFFQTLHTHGKFTLSFSFELH